LFFILFFLLLCDLTIKRQAEPPNFANRHDISWHYGTYNVDCTLLIESLEPNEPHCEGQQRLRNVTKWDRGKKNTPEYHGFHAHDHSLKRLVRCFALRDCKHTGCIPHVGLMRICILICQYSTITWVITRGALWPFNPRTGLVELAQ
jgi:hypothetical protein